MDTQGAYDELGLDANASDTQIKATWRRLVAAWHPDRNAAADAGRRMQLINKAYQHIRQLRDGDGEGSPTADGASTGAGPSHNPDSAQADTPKNTHIHTVRLTLEEAALGCTRTLRGSFVHACSACLGNGQGVLAKGCSTCRGSGAVRRAALFGWLWNEESCADCGGDGRQRARCEACDGSGERKVAYRRRVRIPAGVRHGLSLIHISEPTRPY